MPRPRLLLDTNMWIYLADADAVQPFRRAARAAAVDVLACPDVAIEMLNYGDVRVRKRRLQAITRVVDPAHARSAHNITGIARGGPRDPSALAPEPARPR